VLWEAQATTAAAHLVKGQAVAFAGRFEPHDYITRSGEQRIALELHGVDIEYGAKPRGAGADDTPSQRENGSGTPKDDDIPF
jgi:single-stranded DNA-binding protein